MKPWNGHAAGANPPDRRRGGWNFRLVLLLIPLLLLVQGCAASLPDVKSLVESSYLADRPPEIGGAQGRLTPSESRKLIAEIRKRVESDDILERHIAVMELVGAGPLVKDNKATLLIDGTRAYDAMFRAMAGARDHIHLEKFIIRDDEIGGRLADMLLRKASEGVPVHVIYDSVGSILTPESYFDRLRDGGIRVLEFNPVDPLKAGGDWRLANRDHRKILIVDGKLAITGGVNIGHEYSKGSSWSLGRRKAGETAWRDTDVQIEGPAVAEFQKLFLETWRKKDGPPLPARSYFPPFDEKRGRNDLIRVVGSEPDDGNRSIYIMYVSAFLHARESIHLTNAYFVPDEQTIEAITGAAERGADVKIILPSSTDVSLALHAGRYHYTRLLKAGVKLYEHQSTVLHAKTAVIDGVWSTVGSTNMDMWSFVRNNEVNAVVLSREFAKEMEEMFAKDLAESLEIHLADWKERPLFQRVREWFGHLVRHWL